LELSANLLDLHCLLFELRRENLHLFLLQGDSRFQVSDTGLLFLDFFVLFKEFVEHHRADLLKPQGLHDTVLVTEHEVGSNLGYFLGDYAILRLACLVVVVFERYWLEPVQHFAGFVHWCNVVFEALGRREETQHIKLIDKYCLGATGVANWLVVDAADEAGVTRVSKIASTRSADCDVVIGMYESDASGAAYSDVIIAVDEIIAGSPANSGVVAGTGEVFESPSANGHVLLATCQESKRNATKGRVSAIGSRGAIEACQGRVPDSDIKLRV